MKLERNVIRSVIFGLGLSKESIEIRNSTLRHNGVEHKLLFWRIDAITREIWLKDIHAIGVRTAAYPILIIFAFISAFNFAANLGEWNWYWSLPIWRLPYGWVLTWLFEVIFKSNAAWLITHIVTFLIYVGLIWLTRRKSIQIEYGGDGTLNFNVHGMPKEKVDSFHRALLAKWESQKSNGLKTSDFDVPQDHIDMVLEESEQDSEHTEQQPIHTHDEIASIVASAAQKSLGITPDQFSLSILGDLRIPPGDYDRFLDGLADEHGIRISSDDRGNASTVTEIIELAQTNETKR